MQLIFDFANDLIEKGSSSYLSLKFTKNSNDLLLPTVIRWRGVRDNIKFDEKLQSFGLVSRNIPINFIKVAFASDPTLSTHRRIFKKDKIPICGSKKEGNDAVYRIEPIQKHAAGDGSDQT
jgi:hypothetical protein